MTRPLAFCLGLVVGILAAYLVWSPLIATPRGAPDVHSSAGTGDMRQALRGAPHAGPSTVGPSDLLAGSFARGHLLGSGAPLTAVGISDNSFHGAGINPASAVTVSGWATWCAPTPTKCRGWGGDALLAAVPSFRGSPYTVQVCGFEGGRTNCVQVTVVSFCACGSRNGIPTVIDLSPAAFRSLAPLSRGRIRVTVDGGRVPAAPATDVGP